MTEHNENDEFYFGDIDEDDAYCPGDPELHEIDWDKVQELQDLIDNLPSEKEERKKAAYKLQAQLTEDV